MGKKIGGRVFWTLMFIFCANFASANQSDEIIHSVEIKKAEDWIKTFNRDYPILIFDRDFFSYEFLTNKILEDTRENELKRWKIISKYVKNKTGIEMNSTEVSAIDIRLTKLYTSTSAVPFFKENSNDHKFCAVFPNLPNGTAQSETERLTELKLRSLYSEHQVYENLKHKMSFKELYLFSLYHEVAHCLDQKFLPLLQHYPEEDTHSLYQAEFFAENMAYLKLASSLGEGIAKARAVYRTIYSRVLGEYFARNPDLTFGNPIATFAGSIYNLGPGLLKTYSLISFRKIKPQELTSEDLLRTTYELTDRWSLDHRSFYAIQRLLEEGYEKVYQTYQDWSFDRPDLFLDAFYDLVQYQEQTTLWIEKAFSKTSSNKEKPLSHLKLPMQRFCNQIETKNQNEYLSLLKDLRRKIRSKEEQNFSSLHLVDQLNNLPDLILKHCSK